MSLGRCGYTEPTPSMTSSFVVDSVAYGFLSSLLVCVCVCVWGGGGGREEGVRGWSD